MAGSLNRVQLIGHLGRDPETRRMTSGDPVVNLSVATSESWRDKHSGEKKEKTEWHRIVIFNKATAEFAEKFLRKGSKVFIEGQLATRKWTDNGGQEKYSTEIVVKPYSGQVMALDSAGARSDRADDRQSQSHQSGGGTTSFDRDELEDEIPF